MEADYRVSSLKVIYEPVVRLDQKMFPKRWQCSPTPIEQYTDVNLVAATNH